MRKKRLRFLDCMINLEKDGELNIQQVYEKSTHIDQYLLFNFHLPLEHALGIIRTLHHQD